MNTHTNTDTHAYPDFMAACKRLTSLKLDVIADEPLLESYA